MYRRFHDRFGAAGVVVAVIALIAALSGTALAAKNALTSQQKKEVTKIAKKYAGKNGAPGAPGVNGVNGAPGQQGEPGKDGESVGVNSYAGPECEEAEGEAGSEFTNASGTAFACNGREGQEGSPWTLNGTLPPEATETGSWAFGPLAAGAVPVSEELWLPLTFPVPLSRALDGTGCQVKTASPTEFKGTCEVHFINSAGKEATLTEAFAPVELTSTNCLGTVANPKALPGNLCIYTDTLTNAFAFSYPNILRLTGAVEGADTAGAYIDFAGVSSGAKGRGTFAVTGPTS